MDTKNLIKKVDKELSRLISQPIYEYMSTITDIKEFSEIIEQKNSKEKFDIETGLIYLEENPDKMLEYEHTFLNMYHQYLICKLDMDIREYYTNSYCAYKYFDLWNEFDNNDNINSVFINGLTIQDIDKMLDQKNDELIAKINSDMSIDEMDKKFLEEEFINMAFESLIYKKYNGKNSLMYDIKTYFDKYAIEDLTNPRNIQLYILYSLSSILLAMPTNCSIKFTSEYLLDDNNFKTAGYFTYLEDKTPLLNICGLDTYYLNTKADLLKYMFVIFHEIGHLNLDLHRQELSEFEKSIVEMEEAIIDLDKEFYLKNHRNFYIEQDADNYAIQHLIDSFSELYPDELKKLLDKQTHIKRIDYDKFYEIELKKYESLKRYNINKK